MNVASAEQKQSRPSTPAWWVRTFCFAALGGALFPVWSLINFGSISTGLLYLRGVRVNLVEKSKSFGTVEAGTEKEVEFTVANDSNREVTILNASPSCSCLLSDSFPEKIPRYQSRTFRIRILTEGKSGGVEESVTFFTNWTATHRLIAHITGFVREPSAAEPASVDSEWGIDRNDHY